jgi:hypothetical protein
VIVKNLIGALVRRLAPDTVRSLEDLAALRRAGETLQGLIDRADRLEARVAELADLEYSVNELRQDSLRIAELTDLVVTSVGVPGSVHARPER